MHGVERAVGLFVFLAFLLLAGGFGYYLYFTAVRKGWFLPKAKCHTFLSNAEGFKVGDPVKMFGFPIGEITEVKAMEPFSAVGNVYVQFVVQGENIGYIWNDSKVRVFSADFLGKRSFELVPGGTSGTTNLHASFKQDKQGRVLQVWTQNHWYSPDGQGKYIDYPHDSKGYTLFPEESPALGERLDQVASKVETGLPGLFALTNDARLAVQRLTELTRKLEATADAAQPTLSHLESITSRLRDPEGSLGRWLIPSNVQAEVHRALTNANEVLAQAEKTMASADSELRTLSASLLLSLDQLSGLTSNLHVQVRSNTNLLSDIASAVRNADEFVQGMRKHWLLRSAFKGSTNAPPENPARRRPAPPRQP